MYGYVYMGCEVCVCVCMGGYMCVYNLTPRLYLAAVPTFLHICEIKSGSGLGMKLACVYVHAYICDWEHYFNMELVSTNSLSIRLQAMVVYLSALTSPYRSSRFTLSPDTAN